MKVPNVQEPLIDEALVRRLQQAHAEYIEQGYATEEPVAGRAVITLGTARAFVSDEENYHNRIVLTGSESDDVLDALIARYARRKVSCYVEVNPANFYRDPPSMNRRLLSDALIGRGFTPVFFRSVWMAPVQEAAPEIPPGVTIRHFGPDDLDAYAEALRIVLEKPDAEAGAYTRAMSRRLKREEGGGAWQHFVASWQGTPRAAASLFIAGGFGYLVWGFTTPEARGRGLHRCLIRARINAAARAQCTLAFAHTGFGTPGARNFQRLGFRLAYNFMTFVRAY